MSTGTERGCRQARFLWLCWIRTTAQILVVPAPRSCRRRRRCAGFCSCRRRRRKQKRETKKSVVNDTPQAREVREEVQERESGANAWESGGRPGWVLWGSLSLCVSRRRRVESEVLWPAGRPPPPSSFLVWGFVVAVRRFARPLSRPRQGQPRKASPERKPRKKAQKESPERKPRKKAQKESPERKPRKKAQKESPERKPSKRAQQASQLWGVGPGTPSCPPLIIRTTTATT
jgi:hypothetical protein